MQGTLAVHWVVVGVVHNVRLPWASCSRTRGKLRVSVAFRRLRSEPGPNFSLSFSLCQWPLWELFRSRRHWLSHSTGGSKLLQQKGVACHSYYNGWSSLPFKEVRRPRKDTICPAGLLSGPFLAPRGMILLAPPIMGRLAWCEAYVATVC